ncbi:MAG: hypothetical protein K5695_09160 [Oscillospiraceae bacterium]|nr:hypothetical protein [Oscillospiraceae bacterium]
MKLILCASIQLGSVYDLPLDPQQRETMLADRNTQLAVLADAAKKENACLLLPGELLSSGYVPETAVDAFLQTVAQCSVPVMLFPDKAAYTRFACKGQLPDNLFLLQENENRQQDGLTVQRRSDGIRLRAGGTELTLVQKNGSFQITGKKPQTVPTPAPQGFDSGAEPGYLLVTLQQGRKPEFACKPLPLYRFRTLTLTLQPADDSAAILQKLRDAARDADKKTCLRVICEGKLHAATRFPAEEGVKLLREKAFYAELSDRTGIAIDREQLDRDITLRSGFARQILHDESLPEAERSRLIRLGWSALDGEMRDET